MEVSSKNALQNPQKGVESARVFPSPAFREPKGRVIVADYAVLDRAERTQNRVRPSETGRVGLGSGSSHSEFLAAALFVASAYFLLIEQNVALFVLSFLAFAFVYDPVRVRLGGQAAHDAGSAFGVV